MMGWIIIKTFGYVLVTLRSEVCGLRPRRLPSATFFNEEVIGLRLRL